MATLIPGEKYVVRCSKENVEDNYAEG